MGVNGHDGLAHSGLVILAHEPPFILGVLSVHPSTRQVASGNHSETLEPRVMQVLVALFRADRIVTREELIERCWDGRVVGEDALNRALSKIRHVAGGIGAGSFKVETIARVGYRLIGKKAGPVTHLPSTPVALPLFDRRRLIGGLAATGALGAIVTVGTWRSINKPDVPPPAARSLYDRAIAMRYSGGAANNRQAIAYLREAVHIAPDFGQAWGALALAYHSAISNESPERVAGLEDRLQEAVRQAKRFDSGKSDAAAAMLPRDPDFGRWTEREPNYRTFIQRYPGHVAGFQALGSLLMDVGRWSDAVVALRTAKARNEFDPILRYRLALSQWGAGRISAAEEEIDGAIQRWPQYSVIWQTKIKLLAMTGRPKAALDLSNDVTGRPLDEPRPHLQDRILFLTALATRAPVDVNKAIEAMTRRARDVPTDRVTMALQCGMFGRRQLALEMLEGVYLRAGDWALSPPDSPFEVAHPLFQPHAKSLWPEPRFKRILAAIGLENYWRSNNKRPDYRR